MGGRAPLCGSTFPPGTPVGRGGLFPWPGEKPLRFLCAGKAQDEEERTVLADNKCKCARVTSRIIRSTEDPNEDIVERNIRIIVPLNSRENISDPTSPLRTKFVYHLSDLCKKCDPTEVELDNQVVTATQSNICDEDSATETCYTYDRNKCYTTMVPLTYNGETKMVRTALTPDSCYPD
ncbi:immunoglobulin J chain isoform X1 [Castor canadensis]|uniref:immunoglobulin J chain isoform X1 n=1 Tax=Castor canadensis TaxID=51338 RepID=UPI0009819B26|nr:immunoglobulin J chain isoform X1 [Castor canadensis]